jgi:hypothetical protein
MEGRTRKTRLIAARQTLRMAIQGALAPISAGVFHRANIPVDFSFTPISFLK